METKLLIVDDSVIFRSLISEIAEEIGEIKVCGSVRNGALAIQKIKEDRPHLVTLDVEMPEMDGLQTLREINKINKTLSDEEQIKCVMLSSYTRAGAKTTMAALEEGAMDFIEKPKSEDVDFNKKFIKVKLRKIINLIWSKKTITKSITPTRVFENQASNSEHEKAAIVIGSSTGGPKVLFDILPSICEATSLPIFIVQHMPESFTAQFAEGLNKKCKHEVIEVSSPQVVKSNTVYIASGSHHMLLRKAGSTLQVFCNDNAPENGHKPSADVLFRSAANLFKEKLLALILTGMGTDGTKGLGSIKRSGGTVIAQDEASSIVWGMPGSAVNAGVVDEVLPYSSMPQAIHKLLNRSFV